jgi:hypothetical protein
MFEMCDGKRYSLDKGRSKLSLSKYIYIFPKSWENTETEIYHNTCVVGVVGAISIYIPSEPLIVKKFWDC